MVPWIHPTQHSKLHFDQFSRFWTTVYKMVCPMLSVRCLSVVSVCDVGVLWPNGWMNQDEAWHGGRPRPHCIIWGPSSPLPKGAPPISAHVCCGQTAGCIKMPLGTDVGLGPGHIVLDGDLAYPKRGTTPNFRPHVYCGQRSPISPIDEYLFAQFTAESTHRPPLFPSKLPHPSNTCPSPESKPDRHYGLMVVTDRETDRQTDNRDTTLLRL